MHSLGSGKVISYSKEFIQRLLELISSVSYRMQEKWKGSCISVYLKWIYGQWSKEWNVSYGCLKQNGIFSCQSNKTYTEYACWKLSTNEKNQMKSNKQKDKPPHSWAERLSQVWCQVFLTNNTGLTQFLLKSQPDYSKIYPVMHRL